MSDATQTPPTPPPPAKPVGRTVDEIKGDPLVARAISRVPQGIRDAKEFANEITLIVEPDRITEVCRAFKEDGFNYLVDLAGVDYSKYPGHAGPRFGVSYVLYSFQKNKRVRLRALTDGNIQSVSDVWKTANWHERETFDMFGIVFDGHPNLERILMWDGFNGHPLRKDFPVRGIDTGARIYPEVFPPGGGPKPGSTGKDAKDVNLFKGEWKDYGKSPVAMIPPPAAAKPAPAAAPAKPAAPSAAPAAAAAPAATTAEATPEEDEVDS